MIPSKLTFFEVKKEHIFSDASKFGHSKFSKAPEGLNPIDVILASGKLVLVMMDSVMSITSSDQAVVSSPAIGVNVTVRENMASDHRHQLCSGAVFDHTEEHLFPSFVETENRSFTSRPSSSLSANSSRAEIRFVDLDLPSERLGLLDGQLNHS